MYLVFYYSFNRCFLYLTGQIIKKNQHNESKVGTDDFWIPGLKVVNAGVPMSSGEPKVVMHFNSETKTVSIHKLCETVLKM